MHDQAIGERSIFLQAIEITSAAGRSSYLDAACGEDRRLRAEVEALLAAHEGPVRLLDLPACEVTSLDTTHLEAQSGTAIGPYRLIEPIGEGGMGVVYMAEQQQPVRRKVALKLIKPGMDSKQVLARFEAERQALAMMDHPNIARVLDADATDSGRPYFVMEPVRGIPITAFCDREALSIPERLDLFVLVCRAVQHAHQKGIIHRDLKPSNILVTVIDGVAVPKVIDFGVAKATGQSLTERTLCTGFHQFVGTPLYMSPEQADLAGVDVDTRSDIYSLGVLLYELLTGTTPFEAETLRQAAFDEMRRIIRDEEPPRPSERLSTLNETLTTVSARRKADPKRLGASLKGELDWVVMKALDKDRSRRYETASDFAADVLRHLTGQDVEACPDSVGYRLRKLARRNRVALTTSTLIAGALIVGAAVSVWQAVRAVRAERGTVVALAAARRQGQEARNAVDEMYTQVAEKWIAGQPSLTRLQREFLEKALGFYEKFSVEQATDPQLRHDAIRALYRVGVIRQAVGRRDEAETAFGRVVALGTELVREYPDRREFPLVLAEGRIKLVSLHRETGRYLPDDRGGDASKAPAAAKVSASRPFDAEWELRQAGLELSELGKGVLTVVADRRRLAESLEALSVELTQSNRHPEANVAVKSAFRIRESLAKEFPYDVDDRYGLARSYSSQGLQLIWWGEPHLGEAEAAYREAEARLSKLQQEQPGDPRLRISLTKVMQNLLVILLNKPGGSAEAERLGRRALALNEGLVVDFPDFPERQEQLAGILTNLANVIDNQGEGRILEAEGLRRRATAIQERLADLHPDVPWYHVLAGRALGDLSMTLYRRGHLDEARRVHEGRMLRARAQAKAHPDKQWARSNETQALINGVLFAIGAADRAAAAGIAEEWARKVLSPLTPDLLGAEVVRLSESQAPIDPTEAPAITETHAVLNRALIQEAIRRGLDDPHSLSRLSLLISAAPEARRDPDLALRFARRATEQKPDDGWSRQSLGWALYRVGDWKGCIAALEKQPSYSREGDFFAAMAHGRLGDATRAASVYKLADAWLQGYEKRCEARRKTGVITYPDPAMLRRIRAEASNLLGLSPSAINAKERLPESGTVSR